MINKNDLDFERRKTIQHGGIEMAARGSFGKLGVLKDDQKISITR